jgi:sulfonate transport system ATP-binding protein
VKLELQGLLKAYDGDPVLGPIDLSIEQHESVALLGPSGCGKSTLIRILSGLETASEGEASLDGRPLSGPTRAVGLVFQEPRLMPWANVRDNVRLALGGVARKEQDRRIAEALDAVGLADHADALPRALSGGMAQRAGVARALVRQPQALLLDEPFSALDAFTRAKLQDHLAALWSASKFTLVLVTHDIEEAIVVADRVLVMAGPPGRFIADIRVDLPRPRDRTAPALQALRRRITQAISPSASGGETARVVELQQKPSRPGSAGADSSKRR